MTDSMEDADVVFARITSINDAAELIVEDAQDLGKKLVIAVDGVSPDEWIMENADAILYLTYSCTVDHGSGYNYISKKMTSDVLAKLLYGEAQPSGMIVNEVQRSAADQNITELAGDAGTDNYTRLIMAALLAQDPTNITSNWGDSLLCYQYGMRYGSAPSFRYTSLFAPEKTVVTEEYNESMGSTMTSTEVVKSAKAGEPFHIYFLIWNDGDDGIDTVQAFDGDTLIAEKIYAVNGGSWRVAQMTLTISEPGEHTLRVGDKEVQIVIE